MSKSSIANDTTDSKPNPNRCPLPEAVADAHGAMAETRDIYEAIFDLWSAARAAALASRQVPHDVDAFSGLDEAAFHAFEAVRTQALSVESVVRSVVGADTGQRTIDALEAARFGRKNGGAS